MIKLVLLMRRNYSGCKEVNLFWRGWVKFEITGADPNKEYFYNIQV